MPHSKPTLPLHQVLDALDEAAMLSPPPLSEMFTDVYSGELPWNLQEQYEETLESVRTSPELKPKGMPN